MTVFGRYTRVGGATALASNTKRVARFNVPDPVHVAKLSVYIDGRGPGGDDQTVRGVVYDPADLLVLAGEDVRIAKGQSVGWVDLPVTEPGKLLPAGDYDLGVHAGETSGTGRVYQAPGTGRTATDAFGDGTAATFGSATPLTNDIAIFGTASGVWVPPVAEDAQYARYGFLDAQAILGQAGPVRGSRLSVTCEWHGTSVDPERGSFCIARRNGPLGERVGERLLLTVPYALPARSVVVYCHTESTNLDADVSLTRRAFAALAPLATSELIVDAETLG